MGLGLMKRKSIFVLRLIPQKKPIAKFKTLDQKNFEKYIFLDKKITMQLIFIFKFLVSRL